MSHILDKNAPVFDVSHFYQYLMAHTGLSTMCPIDIDICIHDPDPIFGSKGKAQQQNLNNFG